MTDPLLGYLSFAVIVSAGLFWVRAIRQVSIPNNRGGFVAAAALAAALALLSVSGSPGWLAGTLAGLSLFFAAFFLLTIAIGAQRVGTNAVAVGNQIPAFTALDDTSTAFHSNSLDGNPVLIKFFRGHW